MPYANLASNSAPLGFHTDDDDDDDDDAVVLFDWFHLSFATHIYGIAYSNSDPQERPSLNVGKLYTGR